MNPISLPVTMSSPTRKVDDSVKLTFITTRELSTEEFSELDARRKHIGWLLFADNPLQESDIPKEPAQGPDGKSLSQRLYNSLFVLYKSKHPDSNDFDNWRRNQMEKIIAKIQDQIDG